MTDPKDINVQRSQNLDRRSFLRATGMAAAAVLTGGLSSPRLARGDGTTSTKPQVHGRRKLGTLQVSSLGLGCQDFTGTFYATHPNRADMITLARTAHERGVTFFDAAEAYGPRSRANSRGRLEPFAQRKSISSKFGWNIDLETGERGPGLISRPDHIRVQLRACSSAFAPTALIYCTNTGSIQRFQLKTSQAQ